MTNPSETDLSDSMQLSEISGIMNSPPTKETQMINELFLVISSLNDGPYGPGIDTTVHFNRLEAYGSFNDRLDDIGDDPVTVQLIEVDLKTGNQTILESLSGTEVDVGKSDCGDVDPFEDEDEEDPS